MLFGCALIACSGKPGNTTYPLLVNVVGTGSGSVTSVQPAGIDCGSTCSPSLDAGSSVTLIAASAASSDFTGWSGSCSGNGACVLTMDAPKAVTAGFSPSRIVFYSTRDLDGKDAPSENSTSNIWRLNADGTGLVPLTNATADGAGSFRPQWSPDATKVVLDSTLKLDGTDAPGENGTSNIWRLNADGTDLVPLTNATADGAGSFRPEWSPDGAEVVFDSTRALDGTDAPGENGTSNIWRVNADGTGLTPLTTATAIGADSYDPECSPDGTMVVFHSARKLDGTDAPNSTWNIWRVNADGTDLTPLTTATASGAYSFHPRWSPDGAKIVFDSARKLDGTDAPSENETGNIWRMNADGTGLAPLTSATANGADSRRPQWSADGTKVAFDSGRKVDGTDAPNGAWNIWSMDADGTDLTPLTTATANGAGSFRPQWSPDGTTVVFDSGRKLDGSDAPSQYGTFNVWRVNADGSGLTPLTTATASGADSLEPRLSP